MQGFRRVHLPSIVVGAAVIVGLVVLTGMTSVQSAIATTIFRIKYVPDPNDIVNLAEGTPYVVPDGKILVITDYAVSDAAFPNDGYQVVLHPRIRVDGQDVWGSGSYQGQAPQGSSWTFSSGIRAGSGATVTLHLNPFANQLGATPWTSLNGNPRVFASGYLAKATP